MSSKFFTWTKGDRRNAEISRAGGIVPIPVECISIKGVDYDRSGKRSVRAARRPSQLVLSGSPEQPSSKHSSRTIDSIALHDAAVQSATNLMAVMNDMLRSPPMSAHIFSQTYPPRLKPMHGRPRSRTAPSTPLVEAPGTECAELPGSFPFDRKPSRYQLGGGKIRLPSTGHDHHLNIGNEVVRPHSSPQDSAYALPSNVRDATRPLSPRPGQRYQRGAAQRSNSTDPYADGLTFQSNDSTEDTLIASEPPRLTTCGSRYSPFSANSVKTTSLPVSLSASRNVSTNAVQQVYPSNDEVTPQGPAQAGVTENLFREISHLRESHEAHVRSLKEAHEKELLSHRSYIALLENRKAVAQNGHRAEKQLADVSRPNLYASNHVSAESIDKHGSGGQYRKVLDRTSHETEQLDAVVQKAKENEKSLKNAIADLEARLVAANNERIDVLEGYHEACSKVQELFARNKATPDGDERTGISSFRHRRAVSDVSRMTADNKPLSQQVQDLRCQMAAKDVQVKQLEIAATCATEVNLKLHQKVDELEESLDNHKQLLSNARADSDRYNSLLHHELRRQTRAAADKIQDETQKIEVEAFVVATEKLIRLQASTRASSRAGGSTDHLELQPQASVETLERELEHCIREIIMYKVDAKNYRKELRKAQAKIQMLQAVNEERPTNETGGSEVSDRSHSSPELMRSQLARSADRQYETPTLEQSGLGISYSERNRTSTQTIASATAAALLTPKAPPPNAVMSSPQSRPKTPLSIHKKLPKPPVSPSPKRLPATPPPSDVKVQRTETLRSLSESIISSYARRPTPDPVSRDIPSRNTTPAAQPYRLPRTPASKSTPIDNYDRPSPQM